MINDLYLINIHEITSVVVTIREATGIDCYITSHPPNVLKLLIHLTILSVS